MTKNSLQLQPGLSLSEFINKYGTEQQCETVLEELLWPEGFRCKKCGGERC